MEKHLAQIRIHEELHRRAKQQAEMQGTQFSGYVTGLIQKDVKFTEEFFPYAVVESLDRVYVNDRSKVAYSQLRKILLLDRLNSVSYSVDFTKDRIRNTIDRGLTKEDVWGYSPAFTVTSNTFSRDDCRFEINHSSIAGFDAKLIFPETPRGFTIDFQIDFSLHMPLLTRSNPWPIEVNSLGSFCGFPTQKLTLELYIRKELYQHDFKEGIFTEEQVLNSAEFIFGSGVVSYDRIITSEDQKTYNIGIARKSESDYFVFKLEVIRPIFGLNYCINWLKPLGE